LDKISQTGAYDMSTAVIWSKSKPDVHDSRATCHIAGCNNSIRHIENRFSPHFIFLVFNAVWVLTSGGFRNVSDILV